MQGGAGGYRAFMRDQWYTGPRADEKLPTGPVPQNDYAELIITHPKYKPFKVGINYEELTDKTKTPVNTMVKASGGYIRVGSNLVVTHNCPAKSISECIPVIYLSISATLEKLIIEDEKKEQTK
ncbi:hypothetical protein HZB88_05520 [archaeon]|nr:hypothetical protein [archaeon]